jgi:hypothetical protein
MERKRTRQSPSFLLLHTSQFTNGIIRKQGII